MGTNRTKPIILGGETYTIRPLTINELERVTDVLKEYEGTNKVAFQILRIALERAQPKIDDIGAVEITMPELLDASSIILELAGMPQPAKRDSAGDKNPTEQAQLPMEDPAAA